MLISWMKTNNTTKWSEDGLDDVQFSKNRSLHKGIGRSPYEAMFGQKPQLGITTSELPPEILDNIETEEQLEEALNQLHSGTTAYKENEEELVLDQSADYNHGDLGVSENLEENGNDSELTVSNLTKKYSNYH